MFVHTCVHMFVIFHMCITKMHMTLLWVFSSHWDWALIASHSTLSGTPSCLNASSLANKNASPFVDFGISKWSSQHRPKAWLPTYLTLLSASLRLLLPRIYSWRMVERETFYMEKGKATCIEGSSHTMRKWAVFIYSAVHKEAFLGTWSNRHVSPNEWTGTSIWEPIDKVASPGISLSIGGGRAFFDVMHFSFLPEAVFQKYSSGVPKGPME